MTEAKNCFQSCKLFRCGKNATMYRGDSVWCRWAEEECKISNCSFAACAKHRLLPEGICGETVKRKTTDIEPEEAIIPVVKLRGKALRKVGEKEIF